MDSSFLRNLYYEHQACPTCPSPAEVSQFFVGLVGTLFADYTQLSFASEKDFEIHVDKLKAELARIIQYNPARQNALAPEIAREFFESLPKVHAKINQDVTAMFEGDPAAKSRAEVIRTYPGFYAIAAYRVANELHRLGVLGIPRIITEHAHSKTGIDIHPAAKIGENFCIDHGTGVVIGETTIIGNNVNVSQDVQLMLSVVGDGAFLPFKAALFMTTVMENSMIAQNTCLQMCVVGRNTFIGAGSTFTDYNLIPAPIRALDGGGRLNFSNRPVIGSAVGHNCRLGSGMIVYPARAIESDVVLAASKDRRVIDRDVRYEDSDHHKLKSASLHRRLYPRPGERELETW